MCGRSVRRASVAFIVSDEALSMKMLSEVDGAYCLVVRPSSFLSIKT